MILELPYFEFDHYVLANVNVHKVIPIVIITLCAFASLAAGGGSAGLGLHNSLNSWATPLFTLHPLCVLTSLFDPRFENEGLIFAGNFHSLLARATEALKY